MVEEIYEHLFEQPFFLQFLGYWRRFLFYKNIICCVIREKESIIIVFFSNTKERLYIK